jgi:hypothetical protein
MIMPEEHLRLRILEIIAPSLLNPLKFHSIREAAPDAADDYLWRLKNHGD